MSPKVIQVEPLADFQLRLFFENGEVHCFDLTPYLGQGIFTELKNIDGDLSIHLSKFKNPQSRIKGWHQPLASAKCLNPHVK